MDLTFIFVLYMAHTQGQDENAYSFTSLGKVIENS